MKNAVLLGNPNSGKTTLFNTLTKSNRITGNRFGVTVDTESGISKKFGTKTVITDLPGIYSLEPFSNEEKEVIKYLKKEKYDSIIVVINTLNPLRSFNLLNECLKLNKPVTAALNFCDEFKKERIKINKDILKKYYNCEFIEISSSKGTGLNELITAVNKNIKSTDNKPYSKEETQNIVSVAIVKENAKLPSFKADKILTGKFTAFPVLLFFTVLMFTFVFSGVCGKLSSFFNDLITVDLYNIIKNTVIKNTGNGLLAGLVCDGILKGVGTVISFIPQIAALSFVLSIFEDTGYLSRCAYICDKPLRKAGLQGKCFFCIMTGFGCTVPAILSTRVLENKSDRIKTVMLNMFIPCTAKIPLLIMINNEIFKNGKLLLPTLYTLTCGIAFIYIYFFGKMNKNEKNIFLLELPEYRFPAIKSIFYSVKSKTKEFLFKAGTILIITSVVIWLFSSFNLQFKFTNDINNSIASVLGEKLIYIFKPIGITDKRQTISLISGIFARESIVSSLKIMFPNGIKNAFTKASALSFCLFTLLFPPCFASLITAKKEINNNRLFIKIVAFQSVLAYIICIAVYEAGRRIL